MKYVALTELDGTVNLTEMHGRDCKIRTEMYGRNCKLRTKIHGTAVKRNAQYSKLTEMHGATKLTVMHGTAKL